MISKNNFSVLSSLERKENIIIYYDECERGLINYEFFGTTFSGQVYENKTSLAPSGSKDDIVKDKLEKALNDFIFVTGDKKFANRLIDLKGITVCFSNNTYTLEQKIIMLDRLFKTGGFRFENPNDLLKKYTLIFVGNNQIRCLLRNKEWKIIPFYKNKKNK